MELLAAALAHDVGNIAHSLASAQRLTRTDAGEDLDLAEWAAYVERDVDRLGRLGIRLRALAAPGAAHASARVDDACAEALAEVDPGGGQVRGAHSVPVDVRVRGTVAAVKAAIASLLEHALAAGPTGAPVQLAVRGPSADAVIVEIAAPAAPASDAFDRAPLETLLDTALRDRRGDFSLVLPGALADALGGAVHVASDAKRGLVFELQLVRPELRR
jgi:hypothetical protein